MTIERLIEIYKCAALTAIAVLLALLLWHTPMPLTMEKVRLQKIRGWQNRIPLAYIGGGEVDVTASTPLEVDVQEPVEITGTVQIDH
jgi:hypothetical protein